ncbi:hypothetical protein Micbo1qcDRAFT_200613 [Microdochium bolleyi]|uniref:Uncharacterized protein n=1 Tax=Microdochium bolleyi TaxID=196109 RepID=A0A136JDG5_9PEZI|nr:hypothetical protein Micbo1qcDRAFT_200613 [Microdochium bolleyi]
MAQQNNAKKGGTTTIWPRPDFSNGAAGDDVKLPPLPAGLLHPTKLPNLPPLAGLDDLPRNNSMATKPTANPDFSILSNATITITNTPAGQGRDTLDQFLTEEGRRLLPDQRGAMHYGFDMIVEGLVKGVADRSVATQGLFKLYTKCGLEIRDAGDFRCYLLAIATGKRQLGTDFCGNAGLVFRFEAEEKKASEDAKADTAQVEDEEKSTGKDFKTELATFEKEIKTMAAGLGTEKDDLAKSGQAKNKSSAATVTDETTAPSTGKSTPTSSTQADAEAEDNAKDGPQWRRNKFTRECSRCYPTPEIREHIYNNNMMREAEEGTAVNRDPHKRQYTPPSWWPGGDRPPERLPRAVVQTLRALEKSRAEREAREKSERREHESPPAFKWPKWDPLDL